MAMVEAVADKAASMTPIQLDNVLALVDTFLHNTSQRNLIEQGEVQDFALDLRLLLTN